MARPMPVLPLVASTTVMPGLSTPRRSASSMTPRARRSFTEESGLKASTFTYISTPSGARRLMRTTGVLPTVERMLSWMAMGVSEGAGMIDVYARAACIARAATAGFAAFPGVPADECRHPAVAVFARAGRGFPPAQPGVDRDLLPGGSDRRRAALAPGTHPRQRRRDLVCHGRGRDRRHRRPGPLRRRRLRACQDGRHSRLPG